VRRTLLRILRDPKNLEPLSLHPFETRSTADGEEIITSGILLSENSKQAYPIVDGIPVMLDSSFTEEFLHRHAQRIAQDEILSELVLSRQRDSDWSFSAEWDQHFGRKLIKTWGWTVEQRIEQFLLETNIEVNWYQGKLILDAGCGNGQLSEGLTTLGATVIGLDYSTSVYHAEKCRKSSGVYFIQADLQNPPFDLTTFDLIISNGVLHHTRDTSKTFSEIAKLVKPDGYFYLWLYRKPENFPRRCLFYPALDLARLVVSRLPRRPQMAVVKSYAFALMTLHKLLRKRADLSWAERVVGAYDTLTPVWRHYHTPLEVSSWFFLNGYSAPTITHWDNPYGFGMVAAKKRQKDTPGVNFGKSLIKRRHYQ
jgi:2-polyprenyl-3-methyl-5-hydroxy-6-metoxy-1,4-benzoquinol methylase/uncharacterized protein YbaR (Trm112 family)